MMTRKREARHQTDQWDDYAYFGALVMAFVARRVRKYELDDPLPFADASTRAAQYMIQAWKLNTGRQNDDDMIIRAADDIAEQIAGGQFDGWEAARTVHRAS